MEYLFSMFQLPRGIPCISLAGWWFQNITCIAQGQLEHSPKNHAKAFLLFVTVILMLKCPCRHFNWCVFSGSVSMSSTSRGEMSSAGSGSKYTASSGNFGLLLACCRSEKHLHVKLPLHIWSSVIFLTYSRVCQPFSFCRKFGCGKT